MVTVKIHITGLVQGVGFRPFVYRIALRCSLKGEVENRNDGVFITVSGSRENIENFIVLLRNEAPAASRIDTLETSVSDPMKFEGFTILKSGNVSDEVTGVSPDIAVCPDCLDDLKNQPHRLDYPFINCTNCGPRFTIIRELPYDREMTTMAPFEMCDKCRKEYEDVGDRRFHAQPVACNDCGPVYTMNLGEDIVSDIKLIIKEICRVIETGGIVALKGMGGYHLICDATDQASVQSLRDRKGREGKPFAVMCQSLEEANKIAVIDSEGSDLLQSWQRPIVLLESKGKLVPGVSGGLNSVGIVLPYMPVHYMIFGSTNKKVLVFTSANISDEPVIIDDKIAREKLSGIADIIVTYNREIYNRADDSVSSIMAGKSIVMRRSRGYAPGSVRTGLSVEGIFGAGAELVNTFAVGKGEEIILSQYIGDLKNEATLSFYRQSFGLFSKLYRFKPTVAVRDMHPDYLSSRFADRMGEELGIELIKVQHHHAHIAACMAENMVDEEVIGLSLDGVGLGDDGNIWGGEIMVATLGAYDRVCHFDYVPVVGADRVSGEPWRSALGYLIKYCDDIDRIYSISEKMGLDRRRTDIYRDGIRSGLNCHHFSSAGRLFDAVAAITGVNTRSVYHAEAPMRLESAAEPGVSGAYDFYSERGLISFGPAIMEIVSDVLNGVQTGMIAARFHNTVINALLETVTEVSQERGLKTVVLSGGTFQNRYITERLYRALSVYGYRVLMHHSVPPNDGGISAGQVVVAAAIRNG